MPGWLVLVLAWAALAVPAALFIGVFIRIGEHRQKDKEGKQ